jgi:hypothetical protein
LEPIPTLFPPGERYDLARMGEVAPISLFL